VLVSGATGGIGRAIAEELARQGADVVVSSRRQEELTELARSLPGAAQRHEALVADLADQGAAERLIEDAGDIDGFVANAALPASGKLDHFSSDEVQRAIRVNFESPILMARALAPKLAAKGEGHLVFISSLSGKVGSPRAALYGATKFGLRGFAFGLREDLHPDGVGVSIVSPGFVRGAGMWADAQVDPPPMIGMTTPAKVAKAVARAIRRNRNEITVAPRRQRFVAELGYRHPEFAARLQRRAGAEQIASDLAAGQSDKR
jgi:short-subunit dehydrogenase